MTDETRQPRTEAVAEERRRRRSESTGDPTLARFGLTENVLDRDKYEYRAAVDDRSRLQDLTVNDDYDFVTIKGSKAAKADAEGVAKYQDGTKLDGSPRYTYLLRKPKKFADEDRAQRLAKIDADEKARLTSAPEDAPDKSYTPKR